MRKTMMCKTHDLFLRLLAFFDFPRTIVATSFPTFEVVVMAARSVRAHASERSFLPMERVVPLPIQPRKSCHCLLASLLRPIVRLPLSVPLWTPLQGIAVVMHPFSGPH